MISVTKIRIEEDICEVIKRVDALTVLDCGKRRKDKTRNLHEYQILCNTVDAIESIVSRFNQDINMMRSYELKSFLVSASNQLSAFKSHFESSL